MRQSVDVGTTCFVYLVVGLSLLAVAACDGGERERENPNVSDASGGDSTVSQSCETPLEGTVEATSKRAGQLGIERWNYSIGEEQIEIDALTSDGDEMGTLTREIGTAESVDVAQYGPDNQGAAGNTAGTFRLADGSSSATLTVNAAPTSSQGGDDVDAIANRARFEVAGTSFRFHAVRTSSDQVHDSKLTVPIEDLSAQPEPKFVRRGPRANQKVAVAVFDEDGTETSDSTLRNHPAVQSWNDALNKHAALGALVASLNEEQLERRIRKRLTDCTGSDSAGDEQTTRQLKLRGKTRKCVASVLGCMWDVYSVGKNVAVEGAKKLNVVMPISPVPGCSSLGSCDCKLKDCKNFCKGACGKCRGGTAICKNGIKCKCVCNKRKDCGSDKGDPHLVTLDGLGYDFQTAGEFIFVESTTKDNFEIQVRHEPEGCSNCPDVTFLTAVALRSGNLRIAYYRDRDPRLWINGEPGDVSETPISLAEEGEVFVTKIDSETYKVQAKTGEVITLGDENLTVRAPESRAGKYRGLAGDYDGQVKGDLAVRKGKDLDNPVNSEELYGPFTSSWRIGEANSLFDYKSGNSTETYTDESVPGNNPFANLTKEEIDDAKSTCQKEGLTGRALRDCTLDVACTVDCPGNPEKYTELYKERRNVSATLQINNSNGVACCVLGTCVTMPEQDCRDGGYEVHTDTTCDTNPCGDPGACCSAGSCTMTSKELCGNTDSSLIEFHANKSCSDNPCEKEAACCSNGRCSMATKSACEQLGESATFNPNKTCNSSPCEELAPCCVGGECNLQTDDNCQELNGTFHPNKDECNPDVCADKAACCLPNGLCTSLTKKLCNDASGTYHSGKSCSDNPCGDSSDNGACCIQATSSCESTTRGECDVANGDFHEGQSCSSNPCSF